MFETLTSRLQAVFRRLKSYGRLSESQVEEALREVRLALLEADVNHQVVKDFVVRVKERAVGKEVLESLTPAQQVIKIVYEELVNLIGPTQSKLTFASQPPTVIMLIGLQGSGKTSATAKLGHHLKGINKRPILVAADVYRPAAIEQLKILGEEARIPVFSPGADLSPIVIAQRGLEEGKNKGCDVVIIDTAGRLHIDEQMMQELKDVKEAVSPQEILLVVDGMTGQDAVNLANAFQEKVDFDGAILTKLDGDARGGAALSVKAVTGKPIKFVTVGEKLNALEPFHPDRMASRILGMGDVLTLIEKAEKAVEAQKAKTLEEKLLKQEFDLEDFLDQMQQLRKMGPFNQLLGMLPGIPGMGELKGLQVEETQLDRIQAIIQSMTREERHKPMVIDGSRRMRIAKGSGTNVQEVNQLIKQFEQTKKLLKQFSNFGFGGKMFGGKMFKKFKF